MGRDYLFSGRELAGAEFPAGYDERVAEVRVKAGALEAVATERFIPVAADFAEIEVLSGALVDVYATGAGCEPVTFSVTRGAFRTAQSRASLGSEGQHPRLSNRRSPRPASTTSPRP